MNYVEVLINATDQDGNQLANAHLHFAASDLAWVTASNIVAPIRPVDVWASGGMSTNGTVELFAMDNAGVSTNWQWIMTGELGGEAFPARYLVVNYSNGASQNLADLLQASSLTPSVQS